MERNKIEGVKIFSDFWFRDCYHQQLIMAVSCFGVEPESILMNWFTFIREDLVLEEIGCFSEKELLSKLGCNIKKKSMNEIRLIKCIDKGETVIMGVDTYYLESRPDTYLKMHAVHYILVYGYDLAKNIVYVTDHDYSTDNTYKEKEISLKNILYANKMLRQGMFARKHESRVVSKLKKATCPIGASWKYFSADSIMKSRNASKSNIAYLKRLFSGAEEELRANIKRVSYYLQYLKPFYCVIAKTKEFAAADNMQLITRIISAYSMVLSMSWKMDIKRLFALPENQKNSLMRILDEIDGLEDKMYKILAENCYE